MKLIKVILLCLNLQLWFFTHGFNQSGALSQNESQVFEVGVSAMLIEQYEEAEACLFYLQNIHSDNESVVTNRGINQMMWALSLFNERETQEKIKYIFPFEIDPNSGIGNNNNLEEKQRVEKIISLLKKADLQFQLAKELIPKQAEVYLNFAVVKAIQSRWFSDPQLLNEALNYIEMALEKAPENSSSKGYACIVKGIIYDYLGENEKRDEWFGRSKAFYAVDPNSPLASLAKRNEEVANGGIAVFVQHRENYDPLTAQPEKIEGRSLRNLTNLQPDRLVADLDGSQLHLKDFDQSTLLLHYYSGSRYLLFQHTQTNYTDTTCKEIKIGDNEALVIEKYGYPTRTRSTIEGTYLYYKRNKIIFFIDLEETVQSWMVWSVQSGG